MQKSLCVSETSPLTRCEARLIERAIAVLERRVFKRGAVLTKPSDAEDYLRLRLGTEPHEVFAVLFLDNAHRLMGFEFLFHGTIDSATVYPREVVKAALRLNAAAVIFSHIHPSGSTAPTAADRHITE